MKLDIVRAWKDEAYRQGLNEEQLSTLPANPAGELELTDSQLTSVTGGSGGGYGGGITQPSVCPRSSVSKSCCPVTVTHTSSASVTDEQFHSYALVCDVNVFSVQVNVLSNLLSSASPISQNCSSYD